MDYTDFIMKPKVDFCFKELMSIPEVRSGFLSALLAVEPGEILQTTLLPTSLLQLYEGDKLGVLDVRVLMADGTQIDMEIQLAPFKQWPERSVFYISKMFVEQIHRGEDYRLMQKCIHVGILNFSLTGEENFHSCFHLREDDRHTLYTDKLEIHILELPKLRKHTYPESELLNWARFFNAEEKEEMKELAAKNASIDKAYNALVTLSADEQKRLEYDARQKAILDYHYLMTTNLEEGKKIGYEQGMELGLEQGLEQGLKQGLEQGKKVLIQTCKELGLSKEQTLSRVQAKFSLPDAEANRIVIKFWEED